MPRTREPVAAVPVGHHNAVLRAGYARADSLEERMVEILTPILERAGARAAAAFRRHATDHLTAALLRRADRDAAARTEAAGPLERGWFGVRLRPWVLSASAPTPTSTMVCLRPRPEEAAAIADPDGEPAEYLHVTLVSLGPTEGGLEDVLDALRRVGVTHAPLAGRVGGYGVFDPPGVGILLPDVPGMVELRVAVTEALVDAGIDYARDHGFEAHISVDGEPEEGEAEKMLEQAATLPLHFDSIYVVRGDELVGEVPLVGAKPLTAAADPKRVAEAQKKLGSEQAALRRALESGDQAAIARAKAAVDASKRALHQEVVGPRWTPPAADELIDAHALAQTLRTKTDPVREALVKTTMGSSLESIGASFDATNPAVDVALRKTGSQIVGIADTTRANVMRIVSASYNEGLSIPDTATAIRDGMRAAAPARARTIARTEMAGAVNGGSLAGTALVSDATGQTYLKRWLTAPGAKYPRHETYDGLDGQTVALDEVFEVGASQLQYPGDPDGDAEEVINCRCTMAYDSPEGEQESSADDSPDLPTDG